MFYKLHIILGLFCTLIKINAQTTQNINVREYQTKTYFLNISKNVVVYVNEEGNVVADKAVDAAITYVKKNNRLGINTDPVRVVGNRTDSNGLLEMRKL